MLAFLLAISIKNIIRGPNGVDFGRFRGARGTKIKKLVEKVKALLQIKINCIKVVVRKPTSGLRAVRNPR